MVSISIAMATYNGAAYLRQQLDSLAAQSLLPAELHVGDDGSSDDTLAILEDFRKGAPFPVHIHRNPGNLGHRENFLRTADRCAGDWIAYCDQDDVWLPRKLERCAEAVAQGPPDLKLVAHNCLIIFEDRSAPYLKTFWRGTKLKPRLALPPHWSCAGCTQLYRRDLITLLPIDAALDIRRGTMREAHDAWICMLAVATGSVMLLGESLALYRRHDANTSGLEETEPRTRWNKIARALRPNSTAYVRDAVLTAQIADLLGQAAAAACREDSRALLSDAARKAEEFAGVCRKRALVYETSGPGRRLKAIRDVAAAGGYRRAPNPTFGRRALVKDIVQAIAGGAASAFGARRSIAD